MQYSKNFYQIKSNKDIFQKLLKEKDIIGYYNLPFQDINQIEEYAKTIKQKDIVVIGIGGSSLGTYAIHKFVRHNTNDKKIHYLESTDPLDIMTKIKKINLDDALFIVISKSGTTVETISIFKYLHSLVQIDNSNCVIITENGTKLDKYAKEYNIKQFEIPKNVGGRFSVFSVVGLLPLAIVGVDIKNLLNGCKMIYNSFFNQEKYYDLLMEKGRFLVENKNRFNINIIFSYSALLEGFNKWYIQLWGESLGKININGTKQGLTPIGLLGPVDQHSFLQLIMEGTRDKTVSFIKVDDFEHDISIPNISLKYLEELDYLNNIKFNELINHQADATIEAVQNLKTIPYDIITIDKIDEYNIAKLMFSYELLTSIVGAFVQINTYDQPGVEAGKIILKEKLSKQSF